MDAATSLREFLTTRKDSLLTEIRTKAKIDDALEADLKKALDEWKTTFSA